MPYELSLKHKWCAASNKLSIIGTKIVTETEDIVIYYLRKDKKISATCHGSVSISNIKPKISQRSLINVRYMRRSFVSSIACCPFFLGVLGI